MAGELRYETRKKMTNLDLKGETLKVKQDECPEAGTV
jgi:hypothetical protein